VIAARVYQALKERRLVMATAESCTGGMVAAAITDIAGSSEVFDRGFVTYSNAAKTEMLGVPAALIVHHGAVSREVAEAMAAGALDQSHADISVAVTGIAGPTGGSAEKPVGLVHFACARRGFDVAHRAKIFTALDRDGVRRAARNFALELVLETLE
jgi:nicotinamide-nucleotide amidase